MGDRTLVRARPLVSRLSRQLVIPAALMLGLGADWQANPPAPADANTSKVSPSGSDARPVAENTPTATPKAIPPLEQRPYAIRARVAAGPGSRLDDQGRARLIEDWRVLVDRFVGAPWALNVATGDGPLLGLDLEQVSAESLAPLADGVDKLWMIRIDPDGDGGHALTGRAYDTLTGRLGPVHALHAPFPEDAARSLLKLSVVLFTPTAEIGAEVDGGVRVTVQGSALVPADPIGAVVPEGTLLVPVRIFLKPDGTVRQVAPIGWSYLRVEEHDGPMVRCSVISSLRDPLSRRIIGRHRLVAVGVKPARVSTPFRFETRPPENRPAAGYTLTWRAGPNAEPKLVGSTDREGRIRVPADLSDGLVTLRLLAGGVEPLAEFPMLPGETTEERVVRVSPMSEAVALEARLDALRDEVVDMVATRARLDALLQSRIAGEAWDDVKVLLDQYHELPPSRVFVDRLEQIRREGERQQKEQKVPVLTRTAQARLADTESLILRYLDDELFEGYESAYRESVGLADTPPSPRWSAFAPPGGGFRVFIPGGPKQSPAPADGSTPTLTTYTSREDGLTYSIRFGPAPPELAVSGSTDILEALQRGRDLIAGEQVGRRVTGERAITIDELKGLDFSLEPTADGEAARGPVRRVRTYLTKQDRWFVLSVEGAPEEVRSRRTETFFNSFRLEAPKPAAPPPARARPAPKPAAPIPAGATPF